MKAWAFCLLGMLLLAGCAKSDQMEQFIDAMRKADIGAAKSFLAFKPKPGETYKLNPELARRAYIAYDEEHDKTIDRLKTWPKESLAAFAPVLAATDPNAEKFRNDAFIRNVSSLDDLVADLAGLRTYTKTLVGRFMDSDEPKMASRSRGTWSPEYWLFQVEGEDKPIHVSTYYKNTIIDTRSVGFFDFPDKTKFLIHMLNKTEIGKVELL